MFLKLVVNRGICKLNQAKHSFELIFFSKYTLAPFTKLQFIQTQNTGARVKQSRNLKEKILNLYTDSLPSENVLLCLVLDDGAQTETVVHHVDGGVDGVDALQLVGDEVVDGQVPGQVLVHQLGHL